MNRIKLTNARQQPRGSCSAPHTNPHQFLCHASAPSAIARPPRRELPDLAPSLQMPGWTSWVSPGLTNPGTEIKDTRGRADLQKRPLSVKFLHLPFIRLCCQRNLSDQLPVTLMCLPVTLPGQKTAFHVAILTSTAPHTKPAPHAAKLGTWGARGFTSVLLGTAQSTQSRNINENQLKQYGSRDAQHQHSRARSSSSSPDTRQGRQQHSPGATHRWTCSTWGAAQR